MILENNVIFSKVIDHVLDEIDRGTPSYNSHPDCQRVKIQLVKGLGIEDPGLWRICPEQYRHLLHDERRQELNKPLV